MGSLDETVLIAGASGLLGSRMCSFFKKQGFKVIVTYRRNEPKIFDTKYQIDLTVRDDFEKIKDSVTLVINCAGYTNIEGNEYFPEKSWLENVVIPQNLSEFSKAKGAKFLHVSTDHYKSLKDVPRNENENFVAINKYGYAKLEAEKIIKNFNPDALIVRTNFFGKSTSGSASLLDWVLAQIESENAIKGFDDVLFSPVSINSLIDSIYSLVAKGLSGVYNVSSKEVVSKFEFIEMIFKILKKDVGKIEKDSIDNSLGLTIRPKYMALDATKFEKEASRKIPNIHDMLISELMVI